MLRLRWRPHIHEGPRLDSLSCGCIRAADHRRGKGGGRRDASEGNGPPRRPQKRFGRRVEEVAKAVGGGYCRLQMPLKLALAVRGAVAGHGLGSLEGGGLPVKQPEMDFMSHRGLPPALPMHPWATSL